FTSYSFKNGFLKGVSVGGGYRFESQMLIGRDAAVHNLYGGKTGMGSAMVGYHVRFWKNRPIALQLNVGNLFNEVEPIIYRRNTNTNGQLYKPTHYQWPTPRNWRLTADYTF